MFARRHLILLVALCLSVAVISAPTPEINDPAMIRRLDNVDFSDFERRSPGTTKDSSSTTPKSGVTKSGVTSGGVTKSGGTSGGGTKSGGTKSGGTSGGVTKPGNSAPKSGDTKGGKKKLPPSTLTHTSSSELKATPKPTTDKKSLTDICLEQRKSKKDSPNTKQPQRKEGEKITINGNTFTLGTRYSGGSKGSGDTATFDVTYKGHSGIAKQQTSITDAKFSTEIQNTKAAGDAQGNDLYLDEGCFDGSMWMIMKKVSGKDIYNQLMALKPATKAQCEAYLNTAAETAAKAQANLATHAHFVQGDDNYENYLFSADFKSVNVIDFGLVTPVGDNAQASTIEASQLKSMRAEGGTFGDHWIEGFQHAGYCK